MEALQGVKAYFTAEDVQLPTVEVDVPSLLAYMERPRFEAAYAGPITHSVYDITLMVECIRLMQGVSLLEKLAQLKSRRESRSHLTDLRQSLEWASRMTSIFQMGGGMASLGLQGFSNTIADGLVGTPRTQRWSWVQPLTRNYFVASDPVGQSRQHDSIRNAIGAMPQMAATAGSGVNTMTASVSQVVPALQQQAQQTADAKSGKLSELTQTSDRLAQMAQEMIRQQGQLGAQVAQAASAA
jgi:hypothetical protein